MTLKRSVKIIARNLIDAYYHITATGRSEKEAASRGENR